jgi:hypothetical protein
VQKKLQAIATIFKSGLLQIATDNPAGIGREKLFPLMFFCAENAYELAEDIDIFLYFRVSRLFGIMSMLDIHSFPILPPDLHGACVERCEVLNKFVV